MAWSATWQRALAASGLGTAWATAALAGPALAETPPLAAAPLAIDWSGPFVALSFGGLWSDAEAERDGAVGAIIERDIALGLFPDAIEDGELAAIGSASIGYNAQRGRFVGGVELDLTVPGQDAELGFSRIDPGTGPLGAAFAGVDTSTTYSTEIDALASLRLRAGLALDRSHLFVTAGIAGGTVQNRFTLRLDDPKDLVDFAGAWEEEETLFGVILGLGVEHRVTPRASLRAEIMYFDLEDVSVRATDEAAFPGQAISYEFQNDGALARVGVTFSF